jgi:hypothetical protein
MFEFRKGRTTHFFAFLAHSFILPSDHDRPALFTCNPRKKLTKKAKKTTTKEEKTRACRRSDEAAGTR